MRRLNLNLHILSVHEGKKPYQCLICKLKFCKRELFKWTWKIKVSGWQQIPPQHQSTYLGGPESASI